jgi:hypothetical protein
MKINKRTQPVNGSEPSAVNVPKIFRGNDPVSWGWMSGFKDVAVHVSPKHLTTKCK